MEHGKNCKRWRLTSRAAVQLKESQGGVMEIKYEDKTITISDKVDASRL